MENITEFAPIAAIASPVITIVMLVLKNALGDNKKFIPMLNILVGLVVVFAVARGWAYDLNIYQLAIIGVMVGGTATGLYETGKNFKKQKNL